MTLAPANPPGPAGSRETNPGAGIRSRASIVYKKALSPRGERSIGSDGTTDAAPGEILIATEYCAP